MLLPGREKREPLRSELRRASPPSLWAWCVIR